MDVGIGLPNTIPGLDGRRLVDWAQAAESRGFTTLGTIDRLVYPNYESLITLAAAAPVTERVRLMTDILISPYRNNTPLLAKQAASLDNISGGRLVLGLAGGWRYDDYRASGVDFAARGRILDEQLAELKRLWSGEPVDGLGQVGPEPAREGGPEIMLGGGSRRPTAGPRSTAPAGRSAAELRTSCARDARRSRRRGPSMDAATAPAPRP